MPSGRRSDHRQKPLHYLPRNRQKPFPQALFALAATKMEMQLKADGLRMKSQRSIKRELRENLMMR
jgi:hypothetical protein